MTAAHGRNSPDPLDAWERFVGQFRAALENDTDFDFLKARQDHLYGDFIVIRSDGGYADPTALYDAGLRSKLNERLGKLASAASVHTDLSITEVMDTRRRYERYSPDKLLAHFDSQTEVATCNPGRNIRSHVPDITEFLVASEWLAQRYHDAKKLLCAFSKSPNASLEVGRTRFHYDSEHNSIAANSEEVGQRNLLHAARTARDYACGVVEELAHFLDISQSMDNEQPLHGNIFSKLYAWQKDRYPDSKATQWIASAPPHYQTKPVEIFARYVVGRTTGLVPPEDAGLMSAYYDKIVQLDMDIVSADKPWSWIQQQRDLLKNALEGFERKLEIGGVIGEQAQQQLIREMDVIHQRIDSVAFPNRSK